MCDIDDCYRDINEIKMQYMLKEMKSYAQFYGRKLIYITMKNPNLEGLPIDSDTYAEVEYTGELTEHEKKEYVMFLKNLSMDEEYSTRDDRVRLYCTLKAIRFKEINDEILVV